MGGSLAEACCGRKRRPVYQGSLSGRNEQQRALVKGNEQ